MTSLSPEMMVCPHKAHSALLQAGTRFAPLGFVEDESDSDGGFVDAGCVGDEWGHDFVDVAEVGGDADDLGDLAASEDPDVAVTASSHGVGVHDVSAVELNRKSDVHGCRVLALRPGVVVCCPYAEVCLDLFGCGRALGEDWAIGA